MSQNIATHWIDLIPDEYILIRMEPERKLMERNKRGAAQFIGL